MAERPSTWRESKPDRESKHAAVTGHPSKFNRESLCSPETQRNNMHKNQLKGKRIKKND